MEENKLVIEDVKIENMIYEIRGKQVMLDSDLAKLYRCKNGTKTINLAVKRHLSRFPEDFYFQLTDIEQKGLQSQIGTTNISLMSRSNSYVFTEQGVAMLATVLRTEVAEEVSIRIMDAFVAMRHYIGNNEYRFLNIESKIVEHDSEIKLLQESFSKFEDKKKANDRYFIIDSDVIYHCSTSINYAGSKVFSINILEDEMVKNGILNYLLNLIL